MGAVRAFFRHHRSRCERLEQRREAIFASHFGMQHALDPIRIVSSELILGRVCWLGLPAITLH